MSEVPLYRKSLYNAGLVRPGSLNSLFQVALYLPSDAGLVYTMEYRATAIAEDFKAENVVMLWACFPQKWSPLASTFYLYIYICIYIYVYIYIYIYIYIHFWRVDF